MSDRPARRRSGAGRRPLLAAALVAGMVSRTAATDDGPYRPQVAPASPEAQAALDDIALAEGLSVSLWAAEPLLANPVCLAIEDRGAVLVGETFRHHAGVTDIREHMDWLEDDLAAETVADRRAYMRRRTGDDFASYAEEHDRIRRLVDSDGDGAADTATVFADGFDDPMAGIGAGLLAHDGDVYYTCIPDLWRLRDEDGDGRADSREALSTGWGVHVGYLGHDLHGLCLGADGWLYFSIGDRGFDVVTAEGGRLSLPHTGAVLRCWPDGRHLEIVHTGLRNPQELAFDDLGNLFTGDNNADSGDQARLVHVVQGADSGWRYPFQWIEEPVSRGPWNDESLWRPRHDGQAAYLLPPVANLGDGPSGLAAYPGTGLPARYDGHLFLCDFLGTRRRSGVHAIRLAPAGAGFRLASSERFVWGTLATDCAFGPDGALYVTDWVEGWNTRGVGRIQRVVHAGATDNVLARQTHELLAAAAWDTRDINELVPLLAHRDRRVRTRAGFALAGRGDDGAQRLAAVAAGEVPPDAASEPLRRLARLHAVWALGIAARRDTSWLDAVEPLASDGDPEVAVAALGVLGDHRRRAPDAVVAGLAADHPRVKAAAALAIGRSGLPEAVDALVDLLSTAGAASPVLRHAAVMGLVASADVARLVALADDPSPSVRLGLAVALRRLRSPRIAELLPAAALDPDRLDPALVLEIARAIHDVPIREALPALAALLDEPLAPLPSDGGPAPTPATGLLGRVLSDPDQPHAALVRRLLNAAARLGGEDQAARVATFALRADAPDALRAEALEILAAWGRPPPRDRVTGSFWPVPPRDDAFVPDLVADLAAAGVDRAPEAVRLAWIALAAAHRPAGLEAILVDWLDDRHAPGAVRVAALEALADQGPEAIVPRLDGLLADAHGPLRASALGVLETFGPDEALPRLPALLEDGEIAERRVAYGLLARADDERAEDWLDDELRRLEAGLVPAELALDLVLAAEARPGDPFRFVLARRHAALAEVDPALVPFADGLFGGDRERGREVFDRPSLSCRRCHGTDADAASRVGPSLDGLGARWTRRQIVRSIVAPNAHLAPGYETLHLFLAGGGVLSGRILGEDEATIRLLDADGTVHEVATGDVEARRAGLSAMPDGLGEGLTRREMRDLVAYLASL